METRESEFSIQTRDLGIVPLVLALPFLSYPKVLEGDTQPWVLVAALLALFTFRVRSFRRLRDPWLIALAGLCLATYALRSRSLPDIVRACYIYGSFVVYWIVGRREKGFFLSTGVKITVVVWLAVGLFQYASVALGIPLQFSGRFVSGRSGVPSLAPEPSMYGSLSVLQLMYLSGGKGRWNRFFEACAALSVVLSGSALAIVLLVFPLLKQTFKVRLQVVAAVAMLVVGDYALTSSGFIARVLSGASGAEAASVVLDPSLNLRAGHIYFTLVDNLFRSLGFLGKLDFMGDYNLFAQNSGVFIETESSFILPTAGDIVYGAGMLGALFLLVLLRTAWDTCATTWARVGKVAFLLFCLLNPISISNIFLVLYIQKKEG
jgi:hypothetical protein